MARQVLQQKETHRHIGHIIRRGWVENHIHGKEKRRFNTGSIDRSWIDSVLDKQGDGKERVSWVDVSTFTYPMARGKNNINDERVLEKKSWGE